MQPEALPLYLIVIIGVLVGIGALLFVLALGRLQDYVHDINEVVTKLQRRVQELDNRFDNLRRGQVELRSPESERAATKVRAPSDKPTEKNKVYSLEHAEPGGAAQSGEDGEKPSVQETPTPMTPPPPRHEDEAIADAYNRDPIAFQDSYLERIREFKVENMQAIGKDLNVVPLYRLAEQGQGDYWFDTKTGYVVPRHRSVYNVGQFKWGGLERVFECRNLQQGWRYKKLKIVKVAKFVLKGDELELSNKGVINLSDGEAEV